MNKDELLSCPECCGDHISKAGSRNGVKQYICAQCGRRFNENTGTILEGSRQKRDEWEVVAGGLMSCEGVELIRKKLGTPEKNWATVWAMRANIMHATGCVKWPKLTGVVELGLLYLKDGTKGTQAVDSVTGENSGLIELGICGPAYRVCALAVDRRGMCAARMVKGGAHLAEELESFVRDSTCNVEITCTNANGAYVRALRRLGMVNYIEPTFGYSITEAAGELADFQGGGLAARIECGRGMQVDEFAELKEKYGLGVANVEKLKEEFKRRIVSSTGGVSGGFYGLYAGWSAYAHNLEVELGRSLGEAGQLEADASRVVSDAVGARVRLSTADLERLRRSSNDVGGYAYVDELRRRTEGMKTLLRDEAFTFGEESGAEAMASEELMACVPAGVLGMFAREHGVDVSGMAREGVEGALAPYVETDPVGLLWYAARAARWCASRAVRTR